MCLRSPWPYRALAAGVLLVVAGCSGPSAEKHAGGDPADGPGPVTLAPDAPDPMMTALARAFGARNPEASAVSIVEFRREARGGGANIVLARAIVPDAVFRGRLEDELFGVFLFDDSLKAVRRQVDVFPSPRWNDYTIHIERSTAESLYVAGRGMTHGDEALMRIYRWKDEPGGAGE